MNPLEMCDFKLTIRLAASQPFAKSTAKSCNWPDIETAISTLALDLSRQERWFDLDDKYLVDLPSLLEDPNTRLVP